MVAGEEEARQLEEAPSMAPVEPVAEGWCWEEAVALKGAADLKVDRDQAG